MDEYEIEIIDFSKEFFRPKMEGLPDEREGKFVLMSDNGCVFR